MKLIRQVDIIHKMQLQRILIAIADNPILPQKILFKGGTCASMLGFLDRFSVDLDFDLAPASVTSSESAIIRRELDSIFKNLDLVIDNDNNKTLFYVLKYKTILDSRNTVKLSVFDGVVKNNDYKKVKIKEIDRFLNCQTVETMFANKLVTITDRYTRHSEVAGRDIYDIHHFFSQGYRFKEEIIKERTGLNVEKYFKKLINFIDKEVTEKIINEDLNMLLPLEKFNKIRKVLRQEVLMFLKSYY